MEESYINIAHIIPSNTQTVYCVEYKETARIFLFCAKNFYEEMCKNKWKLNFTQISKYYGYKAIIYLMGLSLELCFKMFILWGCNTFEEFKIARKKLKDPDKRHNLRYLYQEAKKNGLDILSKNDVKLILKLNKYYKDPSFRYISATNIGKSKVINLHKIYIKKPENYFDLIKRILQKADKNKIYA